MMISLGLFNYISQCLVEHKLFQISIKFFREIRVSLIPCQPESLNEKQETSRWVVLATNPGGKGDSSMPSEAAISLAEMFTQLRGIR